MWDAFIEILKRGRPRSPHPAVRYTRTARHSLAARPGLRWIRYRTTHILAQGLRITKLHAPNRCFNGRCFHSEIRAQVPSLLGKYIACDFNVASGDANTAAWKERIGVAEGVDDDGTSPGINKLGRITVERWFHPHTMTEKKDVADWMVGMVATNDVEDSSMAAMLLWSCNMRDESEGPPPSPVCWLSAKEMPSGRFGQGYGSGFRDWSKEKEPSSGLCPDMAQSAHERIAARFLGGDQGLPLRK